MAKVINPWGDGRDADVLDEKCCARPCLHVGEDKGTYVQGRGYTSYHKDPKLCCMTRMLRGCPHPLPEPEAEHIRCCPVPDFPKPKAGTKPFRQKCRTCGAWAGGWLLEQRRNLPAQEHVSCRHGRLDEKLDDLFGCTRWRCELCNLYWLREKPKPRQMGKTFKELLDEKYPCPTAT